METLNTNEFQASVPQPETGSIISHAIEMFKGVVLYGALAMAIYFGASMIVQPLSGFDSQSLVEEMKNSGNSDPAVLWQTKGFINYSLLSTVLSLALSPLFVGVIFIANKFNNKADIQIADLFIGYRQNFGNIFLYSLIYTVAIYLGFAMCIVPGILIMPLFMLGYPILLFENTDAITAIKKSFNIASANYGVILGVSLLSILISAAGVLLCCVGLIATLPFMYVASYSAYCAFAGKPRQIVFKP